MKRSVKVLLHEVFIINIRFVFKLMKRYYLISIACVFLAMILFFNFFRAQHQIYEKTISFKIVGEAKESSGAAVAKLFGDNTSKITEDEIIGIRTSPDFLQTVAIELLEAEYFPKMNFNYIHAKKLLSQGQIFGGCADIKCRESILRGILTSLFMIEQDDLVVDRFVLKIRSLDQFTTQKLLEVIQEKIVAYRKANIKRSLTEQRVMSENIIKEKKDSMTRNNIYEQVKVGDELKTRVTDITKKVDLLNNKLSQYKFDLINAEANLKEAQKLRKSKTKLETKSKFEKYQSLKKKSENLASDISALESVDSIYSDQDKVILNRLRSKLKTVNAQLKEMDFVSEVGIKDKFIASTQEKRNAAKFKVKVLKDKIVEVKKQLRVEMIRKEAYETEAKELSRSMQGHKVSFEYIKKLEQKLVELKLIESTVISDITFDNFVWSERVYKEKSVVLMALFSIVISLFSLIIALIAAFMFDKRILDEEEFRAYYSDIHILGSAPLSK